MDKKFPIQIEEDDAKGVMFVESDGERIAKLDWTKEEDSVIDVHHTFTDPSLRGQGVARYLVDNIVKMARDKDLRIRATCPYVTKVMNDSEEYRKLLV